MQGHQGHQGHQSCGTELYRILINVSLGSGSFQILRSVFLPQECSELKDPYVLPTIDSTAMRNYHSSLTALILLCYRIGGRGEKENITKEMK